ncbi:MAG: zinc ribbon domain-containing protein [Terriglobales bacterium]
MFCDKCGTQLQSGQAHCGRCGKPVLGLVELRRSRVREHVRLLGILWMAYSALHVVAGAVLLIVAQTIFGRVIHIPNGPPPEVTIWLRPLLSFIGGLILAKAAAGFFAGWGLLQREDWARTVALVMGFIALLNVPIGTALGVYTLWVLLPARSDEEYKALAQAA